MPYPSIPLRGKRPLERLAAVLVIAALMAPASAVAQKASKQDLSKARDHYRRGEEAFGAGRYEEAYREFEAGYELVPRPAFLLNMGHAERRRGELRNALALYRKFLLMEPQSRYQAEVEQVIAEIEGALAAEEAAAVTRPALEPPVERGAPPPVSLTAPEPAPAAPEETILTAHDDPPALRARPKRSEPWHLNPWVWAGVGGVVVVGILTAVLLSGGGDSYTKNGSLGTLRP